MSDGSSRQSLWYKWEVETVDPSFSELYIDEIINKSFHLKPRGSGIFSYLAFDYYVPHFCSSCISVRFVS